MHRALFRKTATISTSSVAPVFISAVQFAPKLKYAPAVHLAVRPPFFPNFAWIVVALSLSALLLAALPRRVVAMGQGFG